MIRALLHLWFSAFLVLVVGTACCGARTFVPSPVLKEPSLTDPPMQKAAWTAPKADVPADLVTATTRLFQQGLADPRGCEYRTISVGTGSSWSGDAGVAECHGWVLPAAEKTAQRFAVCWNGMVYPVVSVGDKADLNSDMQAVLKARGNGNRFGTACPPEGASVSETTVLPLKVCMLLRLGEGDLAAGLWKNWAAPEAKDAQKNDVYVELSGALEWAIFDRAICAHAGRRSPESALGPSRREVEEGG